ncbi:hypothetical protein M9458_014721, partial [Cirrhinus mrigala]
TPVCGKRHEKRISRGRIMGGTSAMPGSHPWMAALNAGLLLLDHVGRSLLPAQ